MSVEIHTHFSVRVGGGSAQKKSDGLQRHPPTEEIQSLQQKLELEVLFRTWRYIRIGDRTLPSL